MKPIEPFTPEDRGLRLSTRVLQILLVLVLCPVLLAWGSLRSLDCRILRLPSNQGIPSGPHSFPFWIRWSHLFNLFFLFYADSQWAFHVDGPSASLLERPLHSWHRVDSFTPLRVPKGRVWTAKDDARYISPAIATPGYLHTVGLARSWGFITVYGSFSPGFSSGLLTSQQWERLVPTSAGVVVDAWNTFASMPTSTLEWSPKTEKSI